MLVAVKGVALPAAAAAAAAPAAEPPCPGPPQTTRPGPTASCALQTGVARFSWHGSHNNKYCPTARSAPLKHCPGLWQASVCVIRAAGTLRELGGAQRGGAVAVQRRPQRLEARLAPQHRRVPAQLHPALAPTWPGCASHDTVQVATSCRLTGLLLWVTPLQCKSCCHGVITQPRCGTSCGCRSALTSGCGHAAAGCPRPWRPRRPPRRPDTPSRPPCLLVSCVYSRAQQHATQQQIWRTVV
jgi:hypothetical protein